MDYFDFGNIKAFSEQIDIAEYEGLTSTKTLKDGLTFFRASLKKAKRGKYENQEQLITQKTGHNHEYCLILDVLSS